jgi:hypothetical protein
MNGYLTIKKFIINVKEKKYQSNKNDQDWDF